MYATRSSASRPLITRFGMERWEVRNATISARLVMPGTLAMSSNVGPRDCWDNCFYRPSGIGRSQRERVYGPVRHCRFVARRRRHRQQISLRLASGLPQERQNRLFCSWTFVPCTRPSSAAAYRCRVQTKIRSRPFGVDFSNRFSVARAELQERSPKRCPSRSM
jgi:hypothetical protein